MRFSILVQQLWRLKHKVCRRTSSFILEKNLSSTRTRAKTTVPVIVTLQKQLIKVSPGPWVRVPLHCISCSLVGVSANPKQHSDATSIVSPYMSQHETLSTRHQLTLVERVFFGKKNDHTDMLGSSAQFKCSSLFYKNHNMIKALMVKQHLFLAI